MNDGALLLHGFDGLPADVQALFDGAALHDPQAGADWYDLLLRNVDFDGARPLLAVWREAGCAVAALPLLLQTRGPVTLRSLGNYYSTRHAPLLADVDTDVDTAAEVAQRQQARLTALLRATLATLAAAHPVASLQFEPLAAAAASTGALAAALRANGCVVQTRLAFQNWLLPVAGGAGAWPAYLAARDGRLRTTLQRMGRRFAAQSGRLQLLHGAELAQPAMLQTAIDAWQQVYARSWKPPEAHPRFMPELLRWAAAAGTLRLGIAWLNGQAVAAQCWLTHGGRADIYKLAHDEAHKACSPGTLLTAALMQQAFEVDRVQCVDYLSGDDAYKRLWMSHAEPRVALVAHRWRHPLGLLRAAKAGLKTGLKAALGRPSALPLAG